MRSHLLLILVSTMLAGCNNNPSGTELSGGGPAGNDMTPEQDLGLNEPLPEAEQYFRDWLKGHGHEDLVTDDNGVGLKDSPVRLKATLYGVNEEGDGISVETRFAILLPDGREIIEFLAGMGETREQAISDTFLNFTVTTFHGVYSGFLNSNDEHMVPVDVQINGKVRPVISGDVYMRSSEENRESVDLQKISEEVRRMLSTLPLDEKSHWMKIVYGQADGQVISVSVTLDNLPDDTLTATLAELNWPRTEQFYMVKQFVVIP
ncbi:MAG: hypothetical protein KDA91_02490 [Planctomycetaceae bacterium]|nr:hypothetical protein [Planctomycetaceae bacterium]